MYVVDLKNKPNLSHFVDPNFQLCNRLFKDWKKWKVSAKISFCTSIGHKETSFMAREDYEKQSPKLIELLLFIWSLFWVLSEEEIRSTPKSFQNTRGVAFWRIHKRCQKRHSSGSFFRSFRFHDQLVESFELFDRGIKIFLSSRFLEERNADNLFEIYIPTKGKKTFCKICAREEKKGNNL